MIVADCKKTFPQHDVKPSADSKKGVSYVAADGGLMPNKGEVQVNLQADNGVKLEGIRWQHADVNMPILSVSRLAKKGSTVEFHDKGGTIKLPDGNIIPFYMLNVVYFVKLLIEPPEHADCPPVGGPALKLSAEPEAARKSICAVTD